MSAVHVLYFAWMRERIGFAGEDVALPDDVTTVDGLVTHLRTLSSRHEAAFALGRVVRAAVNQNFALPGMAVAGGDEVAFFPPVTGG